MAGARSEEVRIRTLIGAAEMLRNGITTVQDFLTVVPADDDYRRYRAVGL